MAADLDYKLNAVGDTSLKLLRVTEPGLKGRFFAYVLVVIKKYNDAEGAACSVRVQSLTSSSTGGIINKGSTAMTEKLSINKIQAHINHATKTITLGPSQGINIEEPLRNKGIGAFLFSELVMWLKNNFANYQIAPFDITFGDQTTFSHKEMLQLFFSKFGFTFSFTDAEQKYAILKASAPKDITPYINEGKIQQMEIEDFIFKIVAEKSKMELENSTLKSEVERLGVDSLGGIPKPQLIKYTLIGCALTLALIFLLMTS